MSKINDVFDRMDDWRHLPGYQLERRADLFFSLYLQEALEAKLGFPIRHELIPEFPIRCGTINTSELSNNRSFKMDYLALSNDGKKAIFVELKTDGRSIQPEQVNYLTEAKKVGMKRLLEGLPEIFLATTYKQKYFCLLKKLEGMKLMQIPTQMNEIMERSQHQGLTKASRDIQITSHVKSCIIVYVQPNISEESKTKSISFQEFEGIVRKHSDPISQRFAKSLSEWAKPL